MYTVDREPSLPPEVLYHYTSAGALESILRNGELWATDIRFLNDSTELRLATGLLQGKFAALPQGAPDGYVDEVNRRDPYWDASVGASVRNHLVDIDASFRCYVACFCDEPDLLSQWRGYAGGGGYAIGFASAELGVVEPHIDSFDDPHGPALLPALYDHAKFDDLLERWARQMHDWHAGHPGTKAWMATWWMLHMLASIKSARFAEEREWRMILIRSAHNIPDDPPLRFRTSALGVVPYVGLPVGAAAIRTVRIGPGANADVRAQGVRDLLDAYGCSHAEVLSSDVPYRT